MRGTFQDITELHKAHEERRHDQELLRLFIDCAPGAVAMFDRQMRYLAISKRYAAEYGLFDSDLVGRSHYDVFPDVPEVWKEIHQRCLAGAAERAEADRFTRADGTTDWVTWEIRPWYEVGGEIGGIVLFSEVVTGRTRAIQAVRDSEERFRAMFEHAPVGIVETDMRSGRFLRVNAKMCKIVGRSEAELLQLCWHDITHPDDVADDRVMVASVLTGESASYTREKRYVCPRGEARWVRITVARSDDRRDAPTAVGVIEDITELRRAIEALRGAEARARTMLDTVPVGVALVDETTGTIKSANAQLSRMFGFDDRELIGRS